MFRSAELEEANHLVTFGQWTLLPTHCTTASQKTKPCVTVRILTIKRGKHNWNKYLRQGLQRANPPKLGVCADGTRESVPDKRSANWKVTTIAGCATTKGKQNSCENTAR